MASKYEYSTTTAPAAPTSLGYGPPLEPIGDGWELVGTSANALTRFFEWRRPMPTNSSLTGAKK
jgi:hypothetical protein